MNRRLEVTISLSLLFISLVVFVIHFAFFRYSFPPVNIDEASFFSPAHSFAKEGILSSNVHQHFLPGASRYTYWMPPLYMVLLGVFLKIIGVTVFNAKLLSFIFIGLSAFLVTFITKDVFAKISASALMLICPFILITSAYIRMESMAILLIVISILLVKNQAQGWILGCMAAVLIMTHPMLLPCSAAIGFVVLRRGFKELVIFCIVTLLVLWPYLYYISQNVELFREQMTLQLQRKSHAKITDVGLSYLLQSVPVALIGFWCLYVTKGFRELRIFLAIAIGLTLVLVIKSNEFNYQVYLIPYVISCLAIAMAVQEAVIYRYVLPFGLFGFFAVLLISKAKKYNFLSDNTYDSMLTYVDKNRSWSGKNIFVNGNPDLSTYFIMNNENVERQNAVASSKDTSLYNTFNYVINVKENYDRGDVLKDYNKNSEAKMPWQSWKVQSRYATPDGLDSVFIYQK